MSPYGVMLSVQSAGINKTIIAKHVEYLSDVQYMYFKDKKTTIIGMQTLSFQVTLIELLHIMV